MLVTSRCFALRALITQARIWKRFWFEKFVDKFTLFTHFLVGWNLENLYKHAVSTFFRLSWHFKRVLIFERHLFCKTRTDYAYKLRVQDFATGKNFSFNQCSKQESFAFFSGKLFHKSNRKLFFPVFAYPDINTRGVGGILDSNCLEFPQTLWCLFQAMQTQKMFSIAEMVIV